MRDATSLKRWRGVLAIAALVTSTAALADTGESWRSDVRLNLDALYGPPDGLSLSQHFNATWYFAPLLDDGHTPLALLDFHQHPGNVSLGVAGLQTLDTTLSAEAYPWHETGLFGSASGTVTLGSDATAHTGMSLGVIRYFAPNFRMQLGYTGQRAQSSTAFGTSALSAQGSAEDGGTLGLQWIANDVFGLTLSGGANTSRATSTTAIVSPNAGSYTTTTSSGFGWNGGLGLSGYFGRSFSATLSGEARGVTLTTGAAANASTFSLSIIGGPTLQYFLTDNLYARLAYQATLFFGFDASGAQISNVLSHLGTLSLGGRF